MCWAGWGVISLFNKVWDRFVLPIFCLVKHCKKKKVQQNKMLLYPVFCAALLEKITYNIFVLCWINRLLSGKEPFYIGYSRRPLAAQLQWVETLMNCIRSRARVSIEGQCVLLQNSPRIKMFDFFLLNSQNYRMSHIFLPILLNPWQTL